MGIKNITLPSAACCSYIHNESGINIISESDRAYVHVLVLSDMMSACLKLNPDSK